MKINKFLISGMLLMLQPVRMAVAVIVRIIETS